MGSKRSGESRSIGKRRYALPPPVSHKLDSHKWAIECRLSEFTRLSERRLYEVVTPLAPLFPFCVVVKGGTLRIDIDMWDIKVK